MSVLFCCNSIEAYRPQYLSHQAKFDAFMAWASYPRGCTVSDDEDANVDLVELQVPYAVQLVRQVNYGRLEAKRYFVPAAVETGGGFTEVKEDHLIKANFQKLNTYKNYKCMVHDKFFEVNIYQKDPVNQHHWRANLARPANVIDL